MRRHGNSVATLWYIFKNVLLHKNINKISISWSHCTSDTNNFWILGYKALSQSSHTATVTLSRKISPCQLAGFINFRISSTAWLEIWKMTPFLQHASLTEFLAFKQFICNVFHSNSLVYQRFTECLNWASPTVGTRNTAVINRWEFFPSWNIYFREKTYRKQNKEVTYVLCWVMIESKEKQKEGKREKAASTKTQRQENLRLGPGALTVVAEQAQ